MLDDTDIQELARKHGVSGDPASIVALARAVERRLYLRAMHRKCFNHRLSTPRIGAEMIFERLERDFACDIATIDHRLRLPVPWPHQPSTIPEPRPLPAARSVARIGATQPSPDMPRALQTEVIEFLETFDNVLRAVPRAGLLHYLLLSPSFHC